MLLLNRQGQDHSCPVQHGLAALLLSATQSLETHPSKDAASHIAPDSYGWCATVELLACTIGARVFADDAIFQPLQQE